MATEKRSLFQRIFGTEQNVSFGQTMQMLNGYQAIFTAYNGNAYDNATARSCIDAIARNAAKLSPKHIRQTGNRFENMNGNLKRIISEQPNQLMNAYDFYYKTISQLYLNNNAFIYVERGANGEPLALYPIRTNQATMVEYGGGYYLKFSFSSGRTYTAPLDDVIHLKRFFCEHDVLGGSTQPIIETLSTMHTVKEGIVNAIKTTSGIKGVLKTTQAMLKDEDIKKQRDNFIRDFISTENSFGIAGLDAKSDFQPVNINPQTATDSQMTDIKNDIMEYYGVSEAIMKSEFTSENWAAFYEGTLEPLAIMLSMEFTNKLFTGGQRGFGNKIVFEAQRLQYISTADKVELLRYGNNIFTINELREVFNMAPVDDGDIRMQDLNHVSSDIANNYQGGN